MMRMIMGAAVAGLLSSTAFAADLAPASPSYGPVATAYDWSGAYVGFVAGYLRGESDHTDTFLNTTGPYDIEGAMVGGTVGYNWQWGSVTYGVEGDFSLADIAGNTEINCSSCFTNIDNFGTLRARLGYAYDRVMPYATGGLAFAEMEGGQAGIKVGSRDWVAGWTVGAGIEMALSDKISAKLEGLYVDLDDFAYQSGIPVNVSTKDIGIARVGLNRRF
ncbi:outer membrane protein [Pseudohoeflea suaedae]|nr:outer membrane protein [Pseudohoeflea suaedae]